MDSCISALATAVGTELKGKQDVLVSGTDIKTVNGTSLLGSGDLTITGGGGTQNLYIQVEEPTVAQGSSALWICKGTDGTITFNLVEGL